MTENQLGFLLWAAVGVLFIALGVYAFFAKKPQHFWANAPMMEVNDVKRYNRAVGKLFIGFGAVFIALGTPLMMENKAWILLSVLGVMLETIAMMAVYSTVIERKYKKH